MGIQIPEKESIKLYRLNEYAVAKECVRIVDRRLKCYENENLNFHGNVGDF